MIRPVQHYAPSKMTAHQVQDYIDLVVTKGQSLGEHYVARQLDWAVVELERVQAAVQVACEFCEGTGVMFEGKSCWLCDGYGVVSLPAGESE